MPTPRPKFFETPEFQRTQAEWRKKLRASGFVDLEDDRGVLRIDRCAFGDATHISDPKLAGRAAYFELAGRWLNVRVWSTRLEKRLWELHSEGVGIRLATVALRPMVNNHKSDNELRLYAERDLMFRWVGSEPMLGSADVELAHTYSAWEEAMEAEGYDPRGYLVESDGLGLEPRYGRMNG